MSPRLRRSASTVSGATGSRIIAAQVRGGAVAPCRRARQQVGALAAWDRSSAHRQTPPSSVRGGSARPASTRGDGDPLAGDHPPSGPAGGDRQPFRPAVLGHEHECRLAGQHGAGRELEVVVAQQPEVAVEVGEGSQRLDVAELEDVEAPVPVPVDDHEVEHADLLGGHQMADGGDHAREGGGVGEHDEEVLHQIGGDVLGSLHGT